MPGYVSIDKNKTARLDDIIAILAKKGGINRSSIVSKKNTYYSRTSPGRLAERLVSGKEKNNSVKKRA